MQCHYRRSPLATVRPFWIYALHFSCTLMCPNLMNASLHSSLRLDVELYQFLFLQASCSWTSASWCLFLTINGRVSPQRYIPPILHRTFSGILPFILFFVVKWCSNLVNLTFILGLCLSQPSNHEGIHFMIVVFILFEFSTLILIVEISLSILPASVLLPLSQWGFNLRMKLALFGF